MDLYAINIRKYKAIFLQTLALKAIAVLTTYFLVKKGFYLLAGFDPGKKLTLPILLTLTILAAVHTQYQKKKLEKLQVITDFDQRVEEYEKFYKFRLLWFIFSCLISCALSLLTARYFFLYFAVFDILISLPFFPSQQLFKRELKNEEIILC